MQLQVIQNKIYEVRGAKIMLDFDLAALYEVETRVFNQAVKRNIESFPEDLMFQLTKDEWQNLTSQNVISSWGGRRRQPYAFTEHGVATLSGVLKSPIARKMYIAIVRAFISLRKLAIEYHEVLSALEELRERMGGYDAQLNQIYEALENMLDKKVKEENNMQDWKDHDRVGFKISK